MRRLDCRPHADEYVPTFAELQTFRPVRRPSSRYDQVEFAPWGSKMAAARKLRGDTSCRRGEDKTADFLTCGSRLFPQHARDRHLDMGRVARALNDIKRAFFDSFEVKVPATRASGNDDPKSLAARTASTKQV